MCRLAFGFSGPPCFPTVIKKTTFTSLGGTWGHHPVGKSSATKIHSKLLVSRFTGMNVIFDPFYGVEGDYTKR